MIRLEARTPGYDDWRFVVDMKLVEGRPARMPFYDLQGDITGTFRPFALTLNDTVDYGSEWEGDERERPCNLRHKVIALGEQFTIQEWDEDQNRYRDFVYAIRDIREL